MKTCQFKICPRQSGKTSRLIQLFKELKESSKLPVYMIVANHPAKGRLPVGINGIYTIQEFIYKINHQMGYKDSLVCEHLVIDEYFLFSESQQELLYKTYKDFVIDTVWIETSPIRQYDKSLIDLCNYIKGAELVFRPFKIDIKFSQIHIEKDFDYLYNNFLTDPKTDVHIRYNTSKSMMSKETFDCQYLGKFYKEEDNDN